MNNSLTEFSPTPEAIAAGLMIEKNGETFVTGAGLFAFAAMTAHDLDAEPGSRKHCLKGFRRALNVARAGGLLEQTERVIAWAFSDGINPCDGSEEGSALANLCCVVAQVAGPGRMGQLISGSPMH